MTTVGNSLLAGMSADIDADGNPDIILTERKSGAGASVVVLRAGYCTPDATCNGGAGVCSSTLYNPVRWPRLSSHPNPRTNRDLLPFRDLYLPNPGPDQPLAYSRTRTRSLEYDRRTATVVVQPFPNPARLPLIYLYLLTPDATHYLTTDAESLTQTACRRVYGNLTCTSHRRKSIPCDLVRFSLLQTCSCSTGVSGNQCDECASHYYGQSCVHCPSDSTVGCRARCVALRKGG